MQAMIVKKSLCMRVGRRITSNVQQSKDNNCFMCKTMSRHKDDCVSDSDFYMSLACISAKRSKDPNTKVGACIVDGAKKIIGLGYNGMPNGVSDSELPWNRLGDRLDTKYPYVCHAELNAIINSNNADIGGAVIYVSLFPCNECAKLIIQTGIKEVIFLLDKYPTIPDFIAAKRLLDLAKVPYRQYEPELKSISIIFQSDSLFKINEASNGIDKSGTDYISWSDYFMSVACLSAARCNTPDRRVGVCIVNDRNRIVGIGCNNFMDDLSEVLRGDSTQIHVCNAMLNAVSTKNCSNLNGCTLYITAFPCQDCTMHIIEHDIKEVIFLSNGKQINLKTIDAQKHLNFSKVKYREFEPSGKSIFIKLTEVQL